jgi:hypothetical protein
MDAVAVPALAPNPKRLNRRPTNRLLTQRFQPHLVHSMHPVRHQHIPQPSQPSRLRLFRQHMRRPISHRRQQPRMIRIHPNPMRIPRQPRARLKLPHFAGNPQAKRIPTEPRPIPQIRPRMRQKVNVMRVRIPRRPRLSPQQPRPDMVRRRRNHNLV